MYERAPSGLGTAGKRLWKQIVGTWDLRPDELRTLEDAAHTADLIDRINVELKGSELQVRGSQGQRVANGLLGELRGHRNTLSSLLKSLRLPDEDDEDEDNGVPKVITRSEQAKKAAEARWKKNG